MKRRAVQAPIRLPDADTAPPHRFTTKGPARLIPTEWVDPADVKPDAKHKPRSIAGWRSYDPLRRMLVRASSGITAAHIHAADKLREAVDVATLGYSGERVLIFVAHSPEPRFGLGPAAVARMRAVRVLLRVSVLLTPPQVAMTEAIVLRNRTLRQWTLALDPPGVQREEKWKLLAVLDVLAEHFDSEIRDEIAKGRRLP